MIHAVGRYRHSVRAVRTYDALYVQHVGRDVVTVLSIHVAIYEHATQATLYHYLKRVPLRPLSFAQSHRRAERYKMRSTLQRLQRGQRDDGLNDSGHL